MIKGISFLMLLGLLLSCNKSDNEAIITETNTTKNNLVGTVIDATSGLPITGVTLSILENGPSVITDANGGFIFYHDNLAAVEKIDINGSKEIAVSMSNPNYYPKEINLALNSNKDLKIKMSSKISSTFDFHKPVQLNDGITTGTFKAAKLDSLLIKSMMDKLYGPSYKEVHSVLIYKAGKLVVEEYYFGNNDTIQFENGVKVDHTPTPIQWSRKEKHYIASVNKSLTSSLIGIALDQNNVALTDKISKYLPQYSTYFTDSNKASLNFEDCLTMRAGFKWDEWGSNDLTQLWQSKEFGDFVLNKNNFGPKSEWRYNSALPNLMLKTIDEMVDGNVRNWADKNFYQKLGITDYKWQSQPDGYPEGAARMYLRPRDMLKVGITYLNGGKWNGKQVIPASWVANCFESKVPSGDYSYYFWLRQLNGVKYLSADGDGGNYINIFPNQQMVIVFTQGLYLKYPTYLNQANDMMKNYIFPAMK